MNSDPSHAAGRSCPLHYRYPASALAVPAEHACEVLYVVGGLYGNEPALAKVLDLFNRETGSKRLVFNGDFNWFDVNEASFQRINQTVLSFPATRGNVETEMGEDASEGGCGCAYPDWVGDEVVHHSNAIMQRLRQTAQRFPGLVTALTKLPMHMRVNVGGRRVGIVHGDAESLSGWGFAQERLRDPGQVAQLQSWFERAQVDVFASSHTCLPIFCTLQHGESEFAPAILNNGAAGMPNFSATDYGLITRIATRPFEGRERVFGIVRKGLFMDGIAVQFDTAQWHRDFLAQWPQGSAAHASYWQRIMQGPTYQPGQVLVSSNV